MAAADRTPEAHEPPGDEASLQRALELAYGFLAKRDRTVSETRARLESAGVDPATAEEAIATLAEQGYLDDARYARRFAEDRRHLDGWGSARIQQRLRQLGVPREVIEAAVSRPPEAELEGALQVLSRRFPAGRCDRQERDRALGVLLRRGYDFELACDALRAHTRGGRAA